MTPAAAPGPPGSRDPVLWGVVALATAARVWLAWRFFGFLSGDDVEILQEGFRAAAKLDYTPWNIRNLLLPDLLVAPVVSLGSALGVHDAGVLAFAATLPFVALASLNVVLVYRLASAWLGDLWAARTAAVLYAFHWLPLAYGSTVYPRTASVTCVLLAATWLTGRSRPFERGLAAGGAVALAFAARYSEAVFLAPLLLLCLLGGTGRERTLRSVGLLAGFGVGACAAVGAYDALTWGRPFASLAEFARLTLVERSFASRVPLQPPLFYLQRVLFWVPPALIPALAVAGRRRATTPAWGFLALPLVALSLVAHKELRYLQAAIPFLALVGAAGLSVLRARWRPWLVAALLALTLASEVYGVRVLGTKSMAAVLAARRLAGDRAVRVVALSQSWAYGGRLLLGNRVEVRDLPTPPTAAALAAALPGADRVGVYLKDLSADPALAGVLAAGGFAERERVAWGESKAVVVFGRAGEGARGGGADH